MHRMYRPTVSSFSVLQFRVCPCVQGHLSPRVPIPIGIEEYVAIRGGRSPLTVTDLNQGKKKRIATSVIAIEPILTPDHSPWADPCRRFGGV